MNRYRTPPMPTILALLPFLLVLGLLASGRVGALTAGIAGLAATILVSGTSLPLLAREIPAGLWLSWQVIAIIATGIFFHRCQQARRCRPRNELSEVENLEAVEDMTKLV